MIPVRASACCDPARENLPWLATGRLSADEATQALTHLRTCELCRAEVEFDRALAGRLSQEPGFEHAAAESLQKFMSELDHVAQESSTPPEKRAVSPEPLPPQRGSHRRYHASLVAVLAVQAVAIGVLISLVSTRQPSTDRSYITLSRPSLLPSRPAVRVVFAPDLPIGNVAALLGSIGAEVASGPSEASVYTLVLPAAHSSVQAAEEVRHALAVLRADPRVRFAEPIPGSGSPPSQ